MQHIAALFALHFFLFTSYFKGHIYNDTCGLKRIVDLFIKT